MRRWLGVAGGWLMAAAAAAQPDPGAFAGRAFDCLLEPSAVVDLGGGSPGVVSEVRVGRGDTVREGQVLVRLDDGLERTALARARAQIARGKRRLARNQALYEMKMLSQEERDDIEMDIRLAEVDAAEARERLRRRVLRSPIDGVVVERDIDPGELLGAEPVLRLATLDPLHVEVILPARHFGRVRAGQRARVRPVEPQGREHEAAVTVVDPVVDPQSGTFRVRLALANPGHAVPAGLRCEVRFLEQ